MYETSRAPSSWVPRLNRMDEIWVPSEFQRKAFVSSGVESSKIVVVPESVDVNFFSPINVVPMTKFGGESQSFNGERTFVFLSMFKWEERKNWKCLLRAYFEEFDPARDNVLLVLKTSEFHNNRPVKDDVDDFQKKHSFDMDEKTGRKKKILPSYYVLSKHIAGTELPSLYAAAHAFVLPSRGEGWGRPHAEAMSMSLPVRFVVVVVVVVVVVLIFIFIVLVARRLTFAPPLLSPLCGTRTGSCNELEW